MPARSVVLTALIASCVSSLVTLAVALLVLAPSIRAAPDAQATQPVVRAERFELVDVQGNTTAVWGRIAPDISTTITKPGTGLAFLDPAGQPLAIMGVSENSVPGVFVFDPQGRVAALSAYSSPSGAPLGGVGLTLVNPPREGIMIDQMGAMLALVPDQAFLRFFDGAGQDRVAVGVQPDGSPWIIPQGALQQTSGPDR
ncbi:MAG TPA: hypothetical protein VK066_26660 [Chloroflexota bacterium]|nr:hypothetical protein [Chloroflexota bacterium]